MLKKLFALVLASTVGACAFGNTIDYQKQSLSLASTSDKAVSVGVDDKRPYVVAKDKTPEWVGLVRSGLGIPYGVHTTSGKPLASDFAEVIVAALKTNDIKASVVTIPVSSGGEQAVKLLADTGAERTLLVTMKEWKTDKYFESRLEFSLQADVRDASGALLASNTVESSQNLGGFMTIAAEKGSIDNAREALRRLLDHPRIIGALK